jgi:CHAT domain-containing protein/tetratricopeptide (TPR) repeat protein
MRRGKLDVAQKDVDSALAAYQAKDPEWAARFRVLKARILMMRGSYSESLRLSDQALPAALAKTDTEVERKMVQGLAHDYLQEFDAADRAVSEAEELGQALGSSFLGPVAQTRGILEVDRKNYGKAAAAFRSAAAFGRERHQPRAELDALANLGNVAMLEDHYDEAVDRFRTALEKSRSVGAADVEAKTLGNLGWSYSVVGDFDNAEASFKEAESKAAKAGLVEDQTYWLVSLAGVYFQQRRYAEADSTAQTALGLARGHDDKRTLTTCLNELSLIALATGRLEDAGKSNEEATAIENAGQDQFGIDYSQLIAGRIALGRKDYRLARSHFDRVLADPQAETAQKWEAHARLAEVYVAMVRPAQAEAEFRAAVESVQNARRSIESDEFKISFLSTAIAFYDAYVNFLIDQRRPLDALRVADLSRAETVEQGLASPARAPAGLAFDPQAVARRLNSTLLFYWLGEKRSHLWAVTGSNVSLFPLPPSAEIDAPVKNYRLAFLDPRDPLEAGNFDGRQLYATLVEPALPLLPKNGRVVVLPDGSLNGLNFETLIVARPEPHYWIDDVTVTAANSLALLARSPLSVPAPREANLLLVGDALSPGPDFPPLPQSASEVKRVGGYFRPAQRVELTKKDATAGNFLASDPGKFVYLHFATHGTASRLKPLESAVILSPQGDSYKLYARDVVAHPLRAYLVTISACNGAGTKTYAGEGLVGLSWAFLRAGAHHVIAGLWEVSNASTPQLMDELYKGLNEGNDPAAALRRAKLTLVHSAGNYRKPFYWAPFLLYSGS